MGCRPLSINSFFNRIIASVIRNLLIKILDRYLDKAQKGFRPGQMMHEHIWDVNDFFHACVKNKDPSWVLMIGFSAAFSSVSHVTC